MNSLNTLNNSNFENKGKELYKNNEHYRRLANVMEHPEFREFFNLYMGDWDSVKMILMFMKLYEAVEKHSNIKLTPFQKICIVKDVIDNGELRQKICEGLENSIKENKLSICD